MSATSRTLLSLNNYHYLRGGAESVYFEHARLFREAGWKTDFFSMRHPSNVACDQEQFFVDEIEMGHEYSPLQKLSLAGKVVYSREAQHKLRKLLAQSRPDIAHVHSVYHHISPSVLPVLKENGVPVVLTAHDLKLLCPAYTMLSNSQVCERCKDGNTWQVTSNRCIKGSLALSTLVGIEAFVHRRLATYRDNVDEIVTPSQFYKNKFVEWGWPEKQLHYIPNYVRAEQFRAEYSPGDYFLYFGRLVREKGVRTLIEAAGKAGVKVVIAGTGPEGDAFKALAQQTGARIDFAGFRSGEDLHSLVRGARAVVIPSEWYENAPISLLEAYVSGTPVIGAEIGGIPEMIRAGETGWLFASGSAAQLADVLAKVSQQSSGEVAETGRQARLMAEERFNADGYFNAMKKLYATLGVG